MSFKSGFFDSVDLGDGNYDRSYNASEFAHYFSLLVGNGVFPNPATGMQVLQTAEPSMSVVIQPGTAWINGYYGTIPEDEPEQRSFSIADATLSRIDSVIAGLNLATREVSLYIRQGSYSRNPVPVTLVRDYNKYELELAQVFIPAGSINIQQQNIVDCRLNTERCGIVKGTIEQIDTSEFLSQLTAGFNEWFENLQTQLSGDVAANLQIQIDNIAATLNNGFVKTSSQSLNSEQKEQARVNINCQSNKIVKTITLLSSGWSSSHEQTLSVDGVTPNVNTQLIQIAPSDKESWGTAQEANLYPPVEGEGTLTFSCDTNPSKNITLIIVIWN